MLLWLGTAWAGVTLVNTAPLVADGEGTAVVHMQVEGLSDADSLKLKPFEGELLDYERHGEAVTLTLRPPEVYKPGQMRVSVKARGGVKVSEDLVVPLIPASRAGLEIQTKRETWKAGEDMVVADLDLSLLENSTGARWIRTRRPDLYRELAVSTGREVDTREVRFDEKGV